MWFNMYFWFFFIAFVYIPFGPAIQDIFVNWKLGYLVPPFGWQDNVINIDSSFVNPLVATQAINLALETIIPYLVQKNKRSNEEFM